MGHDQRRKQRKNHHVEKVGKKSPRESPTSSSRRAAHASHLLSLHAPLFIMCKVREIKYTQQIHYVVKPGRYKCLQNFLQNRLTREKRWMTFVRTYLDFTTVGKLVLQTCSVPSGVTMWTKSISIWWRKSHKKQQIYDIILIKRKTNQPNTSSHFMHFIKTSLNQTLGKAINIKLTTKLGKLKRKQVYKI